MLSGCHNVSHHWRQHRLAVGRERFRRKRRPAAGARPENRGPLAAIPSAHSIPRVSRCGGRGNQTKPPAGSRTRRAPPDRRCGMPMGGWLRQAVTPDVTHEHGPVTYQESASTGCWHDYRLAIEASHFSQGNITWPTHRKADNQPCSASGNASKRIHLPLLLYSHNGLLLAATGIGRHGSRVPCRYRPG